MANRGRIRRAKARITESDIVLTPPNGIARMRKRKRQQEAQSNTNALLPKQKGKRNLRQSEEER